MALSVFGKSSVGRSSECTAESSEFWKSFRGLAEVLVGMATSTLRFVRRDPCHRLGSLLLGGIGHAQRSGGWGPTDKDSGIFSLTFA
jgi:hypothetical protein